MRELFMYLCSITLCNILLLDNGKRNLARYCTLLNTRGGEQQGEHGKSFHDVADETTGFPLANSSTDLPRCRLLDDPVRAFLAACVRYRTRV